MRLRAPMGLSGLSTWIPPERQSAREAVALGLIEEETAGELGYDRLPVADLSAPEMAVLAGRAALEAAGEGPTGLVLHSWMHYQGHDLWSAPHYIADRLGLGDALPLGIQQVCNGGAAAVETAIARLLAEPALGRALVTTADRFAEPGFDRWRGDYGIAYGDGATALVVHPLDRDTGAESGTESGTGEGAGGSADLTLYAIATVAAPALERMHRGGDPFSAAARSISSRVDMRRTKKAFLAAEGMEAFTRASGDRLRRVVRTCLADAGLDAADPRLRYVVMPRLGRKTIDLAYRPALSELTPAEILATGRDTGHLGAGDAAAGLAELHHDKMLEPGERALVISAGAGFTWSCLLVGKA
ncbi:3-oxoacyl-[acyl-carrier-protein] synthase III C-terminal domain-containing protein [Streptomyces amakusaensis]|uniref:3-oxoacyl-[acyl-carrier-protein] synthase III C-terminal domain-containing protein n=1 Tax=Streptomyces amakusaensis TaxID=67271 RepID=A0ABW0ADB1_9ACTN